MVPSEEYPPTTAAEEAIREYLDGLRSRLLDRAALIARDIASEAPEAVPLDASPNSRKEITAKLIHQAIVEFEQPGRQPRTPWMRFLDALSGVTGISAILAMIFAAFGLLAPKFAEAGVSIKPESFLDIAKLLAGAIVGSAGAVVVTRSPK